MFRLHDRTRRRLLLVAFVLLCVLPTVLVAGWCAWRNRPGRTVAEAQRLGRLLGLRVVLESYEHTRPGVIRYSGLQLADPETAEPVFRCPTLVVSRIEGNSRPALKLEIETATLEPGGLRRLEPVAARLLRNPMGGEVADARLTIGRLSVDAAGGAYTLIDVEAGLATLTGGSQVAAAFWIDGVETPERVQVRIGRNRQTLPPTTGFELDTGGGPVPCRMLGMGLGVFASLPEKTAFSGRLGAQRTDAGWQGEAIGTLVNVDLERLAAGRLPHRLTGVGNLTLQTVRFQGNRLTEASGVLTAGPGEISRALIDAAARELAMMSAPAAEPSAVVSYEQLALAFLLNTDGLQLYGRAATARGVVLMGRDRWLLAQAPSTVQPRPISALVRALSQPSSLHVPATPEADRLMRCLPVPSVATRPAVGSVYVREAQSGGAGPARY